MNAFERGRITGMPGTEVSVMLHPQRLSVRMRNRVVRMIESHVIEGGWSSNSRKLATALAETYGLQCYIDHGRHSGALTVVGLTEAAVPLLRDVITADWVAFKLEHGAFRYHQNRFEMSLHSLDVCNQNFNAPLHDPENLRKVIVILKEHTTQEAKDKSKQLINLLRGTEPIHLITF